MIETRAVQEFLYENGIRIVDIEELYQSRRILSN
jgi:hypothetical protein